ncbi:MAG TPA: DUF3617 family protein [Allosphingosinicella sp.]|jgi:hypothetical protein
MRALALLPLLIVAGCGGETPANNSANAAAPPTTLPAGQWELASEVTGFNKTDNAAPRINTPVGTRTTVSVCVGAGAQAPSELFMEAGYDCTIGNYYARNGRLNVSLQCRKSGLEGSILPVVDGTFTADSLDYTRNLRTQLIPDGNVTVDSHVTGRRTGECTPAAADGAGGGNSH